MAPAKPPAERQKFWFQFVTTPTADTPGTTLLLHFDNRRYFFGRIAEGTQRACIQRGVGLKKVNNIFLTGPTTWQNMGGLIGMILTMADVQAEERKGFGDNMNQGKRSRIQIHGGPKLMHAMACARRFVFRTGMPLSIRESKQDELPTIEPTYQDENINVWSVPVLRDRSGTRSPKLRSGRSGSPSTVQREQALREETVTNMFDSDWKKDRLFETPFAQVKLPALIWTRDPATKQLSYTRCTTMDDAPHLKPDSVVLVRNPWPAAMVEELPPVDNLSGSVSTGYLICGQPQRGKFLPQKAKALGVKPGPSYARLTAGESIVLDNGTLVTPDMVMTDPEPGRAMAVFDIPSIDYLDDLADKIDQLRALQILVGLKMVSWLLGPGVYGSQQFQDLVMTIPDVQHIVSSPDTNANYIALDSSAASAIRLSKICPDCFLEPMHDNQVPGQVDHNTAIDKGLFTIAQRGMVAQLSPSVLIDTSEVPPALDIDDIKRASTYENAPQQSYHGNNTNGGNPKEYDDIEILTLGTGSAVPSKYRNVSATLIRIPGLGNYLFDCGENTLGQLRRAYSSEELDEVLCDLKLIWISHLHADHHLGTLSVITARNHAVERCRSSRDHTSLHVIAEPNMADFLSDFASIQPSSNCVLVSAMSSALQINNIRVSIDSLPINVKEFKTVRVSHCHGAQAVSVTFANGFKFSYSGDCRPSSAFAKIGLDSHVLLHEATFDDGMEGDAMAKKHCTTGEALGVAATMRAKNVVLTHFSQRYQKIPVLTNIKFTEQIGFEEGDDVDIEDDPDSVVRMSAISKADNGTNALQPGNTEFEGSTESSILIKAAASMDMNICVAFDLMRIKYSQIPSMHLYYPAIEHMFEMEQQKSELKREEAANINGQRTAAKQDKTGSKRSGSVLDSAPNGGEGGAGGAGGAAGGGGAGGGDLYEKINRAKSSKNAKIQGDEGGKSKSLLKREANSPSI